MFFYRSFSSKKILFVDVLVFAVVNLFDCLCLQKKKLAKRCKQTSVRSSFEIRADVTDSLAGKCLSVVMMTLME
jgi:hypothetical protein